MTAGERALSATLVELADTLVSDYDLADYLDRLLGYAVAAVGGTGGGVMLAPDPRREPMTLELLASTDERVRSLEVFELQRDEGPCVESFREGAQVFEANLSASRRWPLFTPAALELGFHSVFAFPMRLRGQVIGALNLFRGLSQDVDPDGVAMAQAYADMATIGILQQRAAREARELAANLQGALNSRVVIEQAKGVLAERVGYEMDEAYQAMRWYARQHNLRLREVAAGVVGGSLGAGEFQHPERPAP
jgi:GAF domain-containing protein